MERESVLTFTYELSVQNVIPFLDVLVEAKGGSLVTSVFRKPTNTGACLNAKSECPQSYKTSVIRAFVFRAIKHCSTWENLHAELERSKQILINNGFSNKDVDNEIKECLDKSLQHPSTDQTAQNKVIRYYRNQMSSAYKVHERVITRLIHDNVTCASPNDQLKLVIYYKSQKTSNILIRNRTSQNLSRDKQQLKRTNVVYKFKCPYEDCVLHENSCYIGVTTTTLSRRLTMHLREGAPKEHLMEKHNHAITRSDLTANTFIVGGINGRTRVQIMEALYIRQLRPSLNVQRQSCQTLNLFAQDVT